jgi:phosphinothricin acetyltransferase
MEADLRARPFKAADAAAVAGIYSDGIAERSATFETEPRTAAVIEARFSSSRHPAIVVEASDGRIVAAAWTSEYRSRHAYDGVAEFSVYVARQARGQGVGRLALLSLIDAAEKRGFYKLVSRVFPDNTASRRLCASVGFREVGVYRRHGQLDGRWRDCVIVERLMGQALIDPGEG